MMAARKKTLTKSLSYVLSTSQSDFEKNSPYVVSKLKYFILIKRANYLKTKFNMYDLRERNSSSQEKYEIGTIEYVYNLFI